LTKLHRAILTAVIVTVAAIGDASAQSLQPVDIRAVTTPSRTVPVSGSVRIQGTVPVKVVGSNVPHAVNVHRGVAVWPGDAAGRDVVYRNDGIRPVVVFVNLSGGSGCATVTTPPVVGTFEVIQENSVDYTLLSSFSAPILQTKAAGNTCYWTMTLPQTLTVGPGETLAVRTLLSAPNPLQAPIGMEASATGHTL